MADQTPGEGQEPEPQGQAPAPSGGQDPQETTFDRTYVEQLRREAAGYRTQLKEAADKLKAFEDADMSERQKLQKQLDALRKEQESAQAALRQERARLAVVKAAAKYNIPASLAEKLVEVEFDDDGNPKDVEAAVKKLAAEYPQLVQGGGGGSPTNPASGKKTTLTREDVQKMTAEEINARWDEVKEVLSGQAP